MTVSAVKRISEFRTDFAVDFAAFSAALTVDDMPSETVSLVKTNLFDTLACAVAGSSAAGVSDVASLARDWGGAQQASILCSHDRVPAHHAAWVNGMMSHARDFDDTHDGAVLHAGVSVIPAALAAAELNAHATGGDLLSGIAVGLELICRLGVATKIGIIDSGFIYTSLFGYFGATVAAARIVGLDAEQTVNALGIAYSQAAGTHQVTRDAALTKRMQPGFAAKAALVSVQLAQRGIRGAQNSFEGIDGLFRTYLRDDYDPVALRAGLGNSYEFANLSYKPYPCCRFNHTAIDAALLIRERAEFSVAGVRRISARVNHQACEAVCTPVDIRKAPKTIVQAQFSIPFTVACALIDGAVLLRHFTEEGINDPNILALAACTDACVDDDIQRGWARNISPTHLVVEMDGRTIEQRVDYPHGHPQSPMVAADFDMKMADCLRASGLAWAGDTACSVHALVDGLETLDRGSAVLAPLCFSNSRA